ncbi:hypothetical protein PUR28_17115 [Streptomyces sp. BE308]|uniref:hypothetical protein n=1 Tax=Streptomyces sp. BE308 TaxID=3002529 RepID=UPI002E7868CF|nr:hypothetical protein [Streptomyces sp. BE308]MEE1792467.1 hypothetical protein [Streptomyces sp. BE308]
MAGQGKRCATYGQLMLFAALLLGIVTMHTVGHSAEHGAPNGQPSAHAPHAVPADAPARADALVTADVPVAAEVPARADAVVHPSAGAAPDGASRADAAPGGPAPEVRSPGSAPMSGMDPLSVCLAVLGAWGLALIGSWLLGLRSADRPLGVAAGARPLRALWPNPPPRKAVLARLSVLRI